MRPPRSRRNRLAERAEAVRFARRVCNRLMSDEHGQRIRHEMRMMTDLDYFTQHSMAFNKLKEN